MEACLGNREHGGEIDDEIVLEVSDGDLVGVPDELAASEDARAGRNESRAELEDHVREVEEVGDGAHGGDGDADAHVHLDARLPFGVEEVEVHGVDEEADHAGDEEKAVPVKDDVVAGVEDAAGRPWPAALGLVGGGCGAGAVVEEGERRAAEGRENVALEEAGHGRCSWRWASGRRSSCIACACAGEVGGAASGARGGAAAARCGCFASPRERAIEKSAYGIEVGALLSPNKFLMWRQLQFAT